MKIADLFRKNKNKNIDLKINPIWDAAFPNELKPDKTSLGAELSIGTLNVFQGLTDLMPNPDPLLKKMGFGKDVEAYQEILTDPQLYGAIENNRKPGVTSLLTYLENPDGDKKETEFIEQFIRGLKYKGKYDNIVNQSLDTPQFGRMVFGVVWNVIDGKWLPVEVTAMPHHLCKFNLQGKLLVSEDGITYTEPLHPARYIVLRHKSSITNPYGEALLSKCYWNIRFKKDGLKLWAIFMERYGMPWVQASYNPAAIAKSFSTDMTTAATLLLKKLTGMARNGIIVFPDGTKVDITKTGDVSSVEIYERLIRICDEQNTKLQLGHSGATESTSGDKLSNDTTATDVRTHIIESDKKYPISLINQLIYWIHQFNFSGDQIPRFNLYREEDVDLGLAERDAALVPVLQLSGLKLSKDYLINNYGFVETDIEEIEASSDSKKTKDTATANARFKNFLNKYLAEAKDDMPEDQKLVDEGIDKLLSEDTSFSQIVGYVMNYLSEQDNFEDAEKKLADLFKKIPDDALQSKLEQMLFIADVVGHYSVQSETGA